jgi:hypothetical protein
VVDGLGELEGDPDGGVDGIPDPLGDGPAEGAGVSSGGPPSIDGAALGGADGTWPRVPELAQPAADSAATRMIGRSDVGR